MIGNPFFFRAADARRGGIAEDRTFVNLFGASALNLLKDKIQHLWDLPLLLISAPGGGKSSLMRIFTPAALGYIRDTAPQTESRQSLAVRMEELDAFRNGQPYALGIWIRMSDEYHFFEQVTGASQLGLFCALLNSRILLNAINGICELKGIERHNHRSVIHLNLRQGCSDIARRAWVRWGSEDAQTLYMNMASLESELCEMIDDPFWRGDCPSLTHPNLWSIELLANLDISVAGRPFQFRPLVMFDDAHELAHSQLHFLLNLLLSRQLPIPFWISIRKQALSLEHLLTEELRKGVEKGRDYEIVDFERSSRAEFKKRVLEISELRVQSVGAQLGGRSQAFENFISDKREEIYLDHLDEKVAEDIKEIIMRSSGHELDKFRGLIREIEDEPTVLHERCRRLRVLQILVEREVAKPQRSLPFVKISKQFLEKFENEKAIIEAADLFLAKEYRLPYYFGAPRLITLASFNINQFLRLAGGLFEETMTAIRLGRDRDSFISQKRQHEIITRIGKSFLKEIPRSVRLGSSVSRFVQAIGDMCREETYRATASYAPGVTGTAITMYELDLVRKAAQGGQDDAVRFYQTIESAIAHNILDPEPNLKCKGKEFLVLYLNRLLCVPFQLPLQRGGFREQKVATLMEWLISGYKTRRKNPRQQRLWH